MSLMSLPTSRGPVGSGTELLRTCRSKLCLLIVEDDPSIRAALAAVAQQIGLDVELADSLSNARTALRKRTVDLILLDVRLGTENGLALLDEVRTKSSIPVVVTTAFATVGSAVAALRAEVFDYIERPFSVEELIAVLGGAASQAIDKQRKQARCEQVAGPLVFGRSPVIQRLRRIACRVSSASHPLLIQGEPGTEKETLARSIHMNGPTPTAPFITVDCSRFSREELDCILFGHSPSEGPGTSPGGTGALIAGSGGTVFLSEIDRLPLDLQAVLLNALENNVVKLGPWLEPVPLTMRIIAACNRSLDETVNNGGFRRDLFARLNMVNLRVPSLRERKTDIPELAAAILRSIAAESKRSCKLSKSLVRHLMEYEWPGNFVQLENAIKFAYLARSEDELQLSDMPDEFQLYISSYAGVATDGQRNGCDNVDFMGSRSSQRSNIVQPIAEIERNAIMNAIHEMDGDKLLAAKMLGIGKTTLYRKLKEYALGDSTVSRLS